MACKESKTNQQQKQVREENPFMLEMREESRQACAFGEASVKSFLMVMAPRPIRAPASV